MKKTIALIAVSVLLAGISVARTKVRLPFAGGRYVTLTNTVGQVVTFNDSSVLDTATNFQAYAQDVSLYNVSGTTVWAMVNCSTGTLRTAITAGVALPIPNGASYGFSRSAEFPVYTLAIQLGASGMTGGVWVAGN